MEENYQFEESVQNSKHNKSLTLTPIHSRRKQHNPSHYEIKQERRIKSRERECYNC